MVKLSKDKDRSYAIWKESNEQQFLEVYAPDYYTLGKLQGENLEKQIKRFKEVIKLFNLTHLMKDFSYKRLIKMARAYEKFIPPYLQKEMQGMADAIVDVSYSDVLLQNCFMDILYGHIIPEKMDDRFDSFDLGCTCLGVLRNKMPIIAQNFDYPYVLKPIGYFIHIITPSFKDIFSFRLGGFLGMPIALNNHISLRISIIRSNMKGSIKTPGTIRCRIALENCSSVEEFCKTFLGEEINSSGNLLISDQSKILGLEILPKINVKQKVTDFIVKTNTFVSNSLQKYLLDKSYSKKRQLYAEKCLERLFAEKFDEITDLDLLQILSDRPKINRKNPFEHMTLAFLTDKYFGVGNPKDDKAGLVPIGFIP